MFRSVVVYKNTGINKNAYMAACADIRCLEFQNTFYKVFYLNLEWYWAALHVRVCRAVFTGLLLLYG